MGPLPLTADMAAPVRVSMIARAGMIRVALDAIPPVGPASPQRDADAHLRAVWSFEAWVKGLNDARIERRPGAVGFTWAGHRGAGPDLLAACRDWLVEASAAIEERTPL